MSNSIYWDNSGIIGRNNYMSMVVGQRGDGKSYSFKRYCLRRYLKTQEQSFWCRNTEAELKEQNYSVITHFLDDLPNELTQHFEYDTKNMCIRNVDNNDIVIYFKSISTPQKIKSVAYPRVTSIVVDEALSLDNTKNKIENVEKLLDICDSVTRNRNNVRCYLLANNVTPFNPYREYFRDNKEFYIEYVKEKAFTEFRKKTKFGRLINNTRYGDFSIDNELLGSKPFQRVNKNFNFDMKKYCFSVEYENIYYNFWAVDGYNLLVEHTHKRPNNKYTFSMDSFINTPVKAINSTKLDTLYKHIIAGRYLYEDESDIPFMLKFASFVC